MVEPIAFLRTLFETAIASATPATCMSRWLPDEPDGRVLVIGAGKAAASMAHDLEQRWQCPIQGAVIVPYGHGVQCKSIDVFEAGHPVPDEAGVRAARVIMNTVSDLAAGDTVICLLSGGGSSLLCVPEPGLTLAEKQLVNTQLLRSGAGIHEINVVRKKLSAIKGGKLANMAAPARVVTIVISDVPGNDAALVASGPTMADTSTANDALEILERYQITVPARVRRVIAQATTTAVQHEDVRIVATSDDALLAASAAAASANITPYSLGDLIGDATELAHEHAALALAIARGTGPLAAPCVVLSGGETTVTVRGQGRGGRNSEYALALAIALDGHPQIHALAGDTDGIDGNSEHAACYFSPHFLQHATDASIDPRMALRNNDSYQAFAACDGLINTGPTLTNVNDFRAILITEPD